MTGRKRAGAVALALAVLIISLIGALAIDGVHVMDKVRNRLRAIRAASAAAALVPLPAAAATAGAVPPTTLGIHVSWPVSSETFVNLAMGPPWSIQRAWNAAWEPMPPEYVDAEGNLKSIPVGANAGYYLITPADRGRDGVTIRCTFTGKASMWVAGPSIEGSVPQRSNSFTFRWTTRNPTTVATLVVSDMDPAHPVRDIDCRDARLPRAQRFSSAFLDLIKGFKVIRFMDWQNTNDNNPVTWATRHTLASTAISQGDGVSLEDMMALAKLNDSDPWFNMPWRADDDYYQHFAQQVHDTLPPGHVVYVELSNEVWNIGFPVGRMAAKEGQDRGFSKDGQIANAAAYSERLIHVMDIWAKVFADDPKRLVRVAGGQAVNLYHAGLVLGHKDLPRHVDAFAIAPYFGYDATGNPTDVDEIYRRIPASIEEVIGISEKQKALANRVGLRLIAYEASQGIAMANVPLLEKIERDPRMGEMTTRYIDAWRKRVGDTMIVFGTVNGIGVYGAWGLVEYPGQPESEAPKLRAVRAELAR